MESLQESFEDGAAPSPFHNVDWSKIVQPRQDLLAALIAVLVVSTYVWIYRWSRRNRPGPRSWPVVGSLPSLLLNWHRLYDFLSDFFLGGHDTIWMVFAANAETLYIAEPSLVEHMLKTNFDNYPKASKQGSDNLARLLPFLPSGQYIRGRFTDAILGPRIACKVEELLRKGIFTSDFQAWKTQRKVASFEFASAKLRDFSTAVFSNNALKLVRVITGFARTNQTMNLQDLFMRITLESTAQLGFGVDLGCLSPSLPAIPFAEAFDRGNELSYHRYADPLWKVKRALNIGAEKELKECVKVMDAFSYDVIKKRREEMQNSGFLQTKTDLLSRFMSIKTEDGELYTDQALREVILNFIIAGRDSTGLALSWFIYNLCLHPKVEEKLLEEIKTLELQENASERVSGDEYERFLEFLTYQNLGKFHYLHAALSETLRLFPAVPLDGRCAIVNDVLPDGSQVRKGDTLTYSAYTMGRREKIWGPDAEMFKPERWLKDGIFQPESPFKFVAFHAGPRSCLGKDSAYLQMKMTGALLVQFFKFKLAPDHQVAYRIMFLLTMNSLQITASHH